MYNLVRHRGGRGLEGVFYCSVACVDASQGGKGGGFHNPGSRCVTVFPMVALRILVTIWCVTEGGGFHDPKSPASLRHEGEMEGIEKVLRPRACLAR